MVTIPSNDMVMGWYVTIFQNIRQQQPLNHIQ